MEKAIIEKMDALLKYVPFIDFLLSIDKEKYIKFTNIKKWIILKGKKYPLSDLNKIEQSIITKYQNLLIEDKVRIPQSITNIFAPLKFKEYVNLCSDEDDEEGEEKNKLDAKSAKITNENHHDKENKEISKGNSSSRSINKETPSATNNKKPSTVSDSDDDLEIISIDYIDKPKESNKSPTSSNICKGVLEEDVLSDVTRDLLRKIDKLEGEECKSKEIYEPNNYCYQQTDDNDVVTSTTDNKTAAVDDKRIREETCELFERRTDFKNKSFKSVVSDESVELFKRRTDFKDEHKEIIIKKEETSAKTDPLFKKHSDFKSDDEVVVDSLVEENHKKLYSNKTIEVISLDSDSEDESCNNKPSTSKAAIASLKAPNNIDEQIHLPETSNPAPNKDLETPPNLTQNEENSISGDKIELLCDSIESAFREQINLNELFDEIQTNLSDEEAYKNDCTEITSSNKENLNIQSAKDTPQCATNSQELNKFLQVALNNIDVEKISAAVLNANNNMIANNAPNTKPAESPPPPAPSMTRNAATTFPVNTHLQPQPQQQSAHIMYPNIVGQPPYPSYCHLPYTMPMPAQHILTPPYNHILNTPQVLPPSPKVNMKDPRIQKQLQAIQKSPLINCNLINPAVADSIMNICRSTAEQQVPQPVHNQEILYHQNILSNKNVNTPPSVNAVERTRRISSSEAKVSPISYGEYKRRKLEKQMQIEKLREEEKTAKLEMLKKDEVRSKIISTLKPCKDQITSLWSQHKRVATISDTIHHIDNDNDGQTVVSNEKNLLETPTVNVTEIETQNQTQSSNNSYKETISTAKSKKKRKRFPLDKRRLDRNLSCTIKGFEQMQCFQTPEERRSSIQAREHIRQQLNVHDHVENSSDETSCSSDSDDDSFVKLEKRIKESVIKNPGYVKLERISKEFIRKHIKRKDKESTPNLLDVHLVQLSSDKSENPQKTGESNCRKSKPRKLNNDCQMTERNTRFCVLCTSKPADLTNHYVRRHKTESYVARLDWSELDDLTISPPFAKLQPQTASNNRINRYSVTCPFCKEEVVETFMSLYNHYASHTGEFAYQCSHCGLLKPYRADIQSHLLHAKPCRNSHVQILYRYPPAAQCIYLHYCNICNFVQLNEANIIKHIREHHHSSKAIVANVGKCILAAMSDITAENNIASKPLSPQPSSSSADSEQKIIQQEHRESNVATQQTQNEIKFKVEDDDVPVSNEPCTDEIFEENKTSPEEQLKQMHEDPPNVQVPMTVVHFTENLTKDSTEFDYVRKEPTNVNITPQKSLPATVKVEQLEINEQVIQTPPRPALNTSSLIQHTHSSTNTQSEGYAPYEKYRSYPETVNYLGLYKCMIDDCYYSTDCSEEFLRHLADHASDTTTNEYLQCPYCIIPMTTSSSLTAKELVEHVRLEHQHMIYQCSMCCYRSCECSNVLIHQKSHHSNDLKACKIYKCNAHEESSSRRKQMDLNELINKNVYKIACSVCHISFYNSNLLVKHITCTHNVTCASLLKIYSCIYCPLTHNDINLLRLHVATKHPGEIPQLYDRNGQVHKTEDCLTSLNVINLSEAVPSIDVARVVNDSVPQDPKDIKPDLEQLQQMNEDTIKIRLRKLTNHTGIAPDTLYRCPITSCGGFFSVYELWLKHMKLRHFALECECPHCPTESATAPTVFSLESIRLHFEQHRRHTFLCFYCTFSSPNEQAALEHGHQEHSTFCPMRFEKVRFNINYSYSIMLHNSLFPNREDFINEFLMILEKRLIDMEAIEKQKLKHQWPLSSNTAWLEDFPNMFDERNINFRCLIKTCKYRSPNKSTLFQHLNSSHKVSRSKYCCSTCNYSLETSTFEDICNHMKTHTYSLFICAACSLQSSSRSKLSLHIRDQHTARDVAVVHLFTVEQQIYHKIYIVFANDYLTFSSMKNCFCCTEKNMSGIAFSLHLKRYHNLVLNYHCERCINFPFKSLEEVKGHFKEFHKEDSIKIRCELSTQKDLSVLALNEFKVQISNDVHYQESKPLLVNIKDEPYDSSDDCVILLEDDDLVIEKSLKDKANIEDKPKLKCKSFDNLKVAVNSNIAPQTNGTQRQLIESTPTTLPLSGFNGQPSYSRNNNSFTTNVSNTYNIVTKPPAYNVCSTITTFPNHAIPIVAENVTSNRIVDSDNSSSNQKRFIQSNFTSIPYTGLNANHSAFSFSVHLPGRSNNHQYIEQNFNN